MKLQVVKEVLTEDCDLRRDFFFLVKFSTLFVFRENKQSLGRKTRSKIFCIDPSNQLNHSNLQPLSEMFQTDLMRNFYSSQILNPIFFSRKQIIIRKKNEMENTRNLDSVQIHQALSETKTIQKHCPMTRTFILYLSSTMPLFS